MKKKIKILLVGLGSEIGSTLLYLFTQNKNYFVIEGVLTNKIYKNDLHKSFETLLARIVLNEPSLVDKVSFDLENSNLRILGHNIKIYWGDIKKFNLRVFKKKFDVSIVSTSKKHINNKKVMKRFLKVSTFVLGAAESKNLPSIYPSLLKTNSNIIQAKPINLFDVKEKVFALGSCQSNGWQSQLKALIEGFSSLNVNDTSILGCELDIIHPDTPQGKIGTKKIEPREQDARNNFRPGFSQVEISMNKLFENAHKLNTISLRTLITPPGYQISRFFMNIKKEESLKIDKQIFKNVLMKNSKKNKHFYFTTTFPFGSKAYERLETAAVILLGDEYFHFNKNFLKFNLNDNCVLSEIIFQSYVHNTRGYCKSVLETIKTIFHEKNRNKYLNCWK